MNIVDGAFEEHIVLEESEDLKVEGDSIVLDAFEIFEVAIEHGGTYTTQTSGIVSQWYGGKYKSFCGRRLSTTTQCYGIITTYLSV